MKLHQMAWRNLWRRKRRTWITGFSIGFGVMLAVTFTGAGDYAYTNMINLGASMGLGHITIEPVGYNQTPSLDKRLQQTDVIHDRVLSIPGVSDATIRIMGQAMFATAGKSVGGMFIAIDPALETVEHNLLIRSLQQGILFPDANGQGIVIGDKMAKNLKIGLGNKLVYTTTDANGEIVSEIARVSGIFQTGVDEVDGAMVLLPINRVRKTLHYNEHEATLIAVIIDDQRYTEKMREKISAVVGTPQREVLGWKDTQADLAGIIAMDRSSNYISQFLIGLLIAAGILNTLLMSVLERTREFGVMMAVGTSPSTLFRLVLVESFWLAVFGLIIGIIITTPWYLYMYYSGIDFTGFMGGETSAGGVLVDPILKLRLFKESSIAILAGVFSLTLISGIYPAWRAGRVPPVESLKAM
jgi:ABC-type lipoprotein release transport system permease subunit